MRGNSTIQWIKDQKLKGFSDEKIMMTLSKNGTDPKTINSLINEVDNNSDTNYFLEKKGKYFKFFFMNSLSLAAFALLMPLGLMGIIASLIDINLIYFYLIIIIHSFFSGKLIYFIYNQLNNSYDYLLFYGIKYSSFISVFFALNKGVEIILNIFMDSHGLMLNEMESIIAYGNILNSYIGFVLALIFFNLPFFIGFYNKQDFKWIKSLYYLIPIIIFFIGLYLVGFFFTMIMFTL